MVTVIVGVGDGINVGVTEGVVDPGVMVLVNLGLMVERGVRMDPTTGVGVEVGVGEVV